MFLFIGLVVFIIAAFPVPRRLSLGTKESIEKYRRSSMIWKYSRLCVASALFLLGTGLMITVIVSQM